MTDPNTDPILTEAFDLISEDESETEVTFAEVAQWEVLDEDTPPSPEDCVS